MLNTIRQHKKAASKLSDTANHIHIIRYQCQIYIYNYFTEYKIVLIAITSYSDKIGPNVMKDENNASAKSVYHVWCLVQAILLLKNTVQ